MFLKFVRYQAVQEHLLPVLLEHAKTVAQLPVLPDNLVGLCAALLYLVGVPAAEISSGGDASASGKLEWEKVREHLQATDNLQEKAKAAELRGARPRDSTPAEHRYNCIKALIPAEFNPEDHFEKQSAVECFRLFVSAAADLR